MDFQDIMYKSMTVKNINVWKNNFHKYYMYDIV